MAPNPNAGNRSMTKPKAEQGFLPFETLDIPPVFDAAVSEKLKANGMALAASHLIERLVLARTIAVELCQQNGSTTADAVGDVLLKRHGIKSLGGAAGSIFKSGQFEPTGRLVKSQRTTNHSRLIFEWKLR